MLKSINRKLTKNSNSNGLNADEEIVQIEENKIKIEKPHNEGASGLAMASFNLCNCIIGSGIITLPYSMTLSGMPFGLILVAISAVMTALTLCMLAMLGDHYSIYNYITLTKHVFGPWPSYLLALCHILFPIFISISYTIAITDNIVIILNNYFPSIVILSNRYFVTSMLVLFILLPLSIAKSISVLDKFSTCSVIFCIYYTLVIVAYSYFMMNNVFYPTDILQFIKPNIAQALGALAFSMTPHHNWFQVQRSINAKSTVSNFKIINISIFISMFIYYIVSISGFVSFSGIIQSNIFSNYCQDDVLINVTRAIFSSTILLTYPLQIIAAREVILTYIYKTNVKKGYYLTAATSICLVLLITCISFSTNVLGPIVEIGGSLTASPIALIFPPLLYIKTFANGGFRGCSLVHAICYLLISIGIFGMIFGTSMTIISVTSSVNGNSNIAMYTADKYFCPIEMP